MKSALIDLNLKKLWVVYPGSKRYYVHEKGIVIPLGEIPSKWSYE
jgi:hypothetical protein